MALGAPDWGRQRMWGLRLLSTLLIITVFFMPIVRHGERLFRPSAFRKTFAIDAAARSFLLS
jgi:Cu/Ag efflux pump CusA